MSHARVVLVESSSDARAVLRLALEHRGLEVFEADGARRGLEMARVHQPEVIVLDLEAEAADEEDIQHDFAEAAAKNASALVVLGKARYLGALPTGSEVAKPYHYAPLIHKIEALAASRTLRDRRRSA